MTSSKTCPRCLTTKPTSDFHKGFRHCKACQDEERVEQRAYDKSHPEAPKHCSKCHQTLRTKDFTPGYHRCRKCNAAAQLERRESDRKRAPNATRRCFRCGQTKSLAEFHPGSWCKQCYSEHHHEDHTRRPERYLLHGAKGRAKRDAVPLNISVEDIRIPVVCPDLGIPLAPARGKVQPNSPTLDRIIPALGYTKGNIRVISSAANRMKQETTLLQSARIWSNVLQTLPHGYELDAATREALLWLSTCIQQALSDEPNV